MRHHSTDLPWCLVGAHNPEMTTDKHTCTETVRAEDLALDCGRFIAQGVQRHVAFVVLEELLQETTEAQVTVELTVRREDLDELCAFTASGKLLAAHA